MMERLRDLTGVLLGHITTIEATYEIAMSALRLGIPGDFCECGVFAGAQSAAMARAILDHDYDVDLGADVTEKRRVHLFDSFQGIPAAGPEDNDYRAGGHQPGTAECSLGQVKAYMKGWGVPEELLVYHEGLFRHTVPRAAGFGVPSPDGEIGAAQHIEHISVLRLDGDLYESTKVCMEYLYPLVSPGGFVICDDWNLDGCRKAVYETVCPAPIYWRKS